MFMNGVNYNMREQQQQQQPQQRRLPIATNERQALETAQARTAIRNV